MKLRLWNGAKSKSAWDETSPDFIDDWKPECTEIEVAEFQITYSDHVKVYKPNGEQFELSWDEDGLLPFEGIFYGDVSVVP